MNIFKKYKSNTIAIFVSLAFYGILFFLLNVIPGTDSSSLLDKDKNEEAIQFQLLEDIHLPPPTETDKTADKKAPAEPTKETPATEQVKSVDEVKDYSQNDEETNVIENQDSVILAELKKSLEVFKEIAPTDSIEKKIIQQKRTEKVRQALTDKTHYTEDDWQFIRNNYRIIQNIKRVYPYVQKTKNVVDSLNMKLAKINNQGERRRLIKETEKVLFQQFEKDVRKMSYSQGKLLLKLIARETDQSAYGLIKTYKGGIPATFWYGVGLLFHEDLKVKYDSVGEDALLEQIIKKYKIGKL
jgi:hypothetical protein